MSSRSIRSSHLCRKGIHLVLQNLPLAVSNSAPKHFESSYKFLTLDCLGHVWKSNLGAFWRASWRNTAGQRLFFGALDTHRVLLYSQVISRSVFEASLEPFLAVSGTMLYFCDRAKNRTRRRHRYLECVNLLFLLYGLHVIPTCRLRGYAAVELWR